MRFFIWTETSAKRWVASVIRANDFTVATDVKSLLVDQ
ncbi:hypothetical protein OCAR_5811 [Afipia carboxidovorans OM5]|nr:hypothetical protein OCAR_5811 [Afipia carboxidovorans OM5]